MLFNFGSVQTLSMKVLLICDCIKLSFYFCRRIATLFCKLGCLKIVVFWYTLIDNFQETKIAGLALPRRAMYRSPTKMLMARPGFSFSFIHFKIHSIYKFQYKLHQIQEYRYNTNNTRT